MGKIAEDARLQVEHGYVLHDFEKGTDNGDHIKYKYTHTVKLFSFLKNQAPIIRPDGVKTGLKVKPAVAAGNNNVDIEAGTAFIAGVDVAINAATNLACTRTAGGVTYQITSIIVDSAGSITAIGGTEGASFSTVRGAAGGPPYITVDKIEIAQVKFTSNTDAVVLASEIDQNVMERYDIPSYNIVEHDADLLQSIIKMLTALDTRHTGDVTKGIWVKHYEPVMNDIPGVSNWKPPEIKGKIQRNTTYDGISAVARTDIGDGGFEVELKGEAGEIMAQIVSGARWLRFYPDKFKADNHICLGFLDWDRDYPPDNMIKAKVGVLGIVAAVEKGS